VKIINMPIWFNVHRTFMILVPVISIISFLVILSFEQWSWVDQSNQLNFAHSIIGMITIGFSIIQMGVAFIRPHPGTPKRPIFNYFHRTLGLTTFTLAIVTIYLGVCMDDMNLGSMGWGIMIGWTIWIIIFPLILEITQAFFFRKRSGKKVK
jgi:uncharacterized membrane protein